MNAIERKITRLTEEAERAEREMVIYDRRASMAKAEMEKNARKWQDAREQRVRLQGLLIEARSEAHRDEVIAERERQVVEVSHG